MKQVFLRDAQAVVEEVPAPAKGEGEVLVKVVRSCISTGTELSGIIARKIPEKTPEPSTPEILLWKQILTDPGIWVRAIKDPRKIIRFIFRLFRLIFKKPPADAPLWRRALTDFSLWKRAIRDPGKVLRVFNMVRNRGLKYTATVIEQQLSLAYPLGYSAAGVVLETSESINDISPGDRVACAGARCAHHAEIISVPRNLLVPVPDELSFDEAAPVALGAIAMQGVRRAMPSLGEKFIVIGLGLLGQMVAQLLKANGCSVIGTDLDKRRIRRAEELGMDFGLDPGDGDPVEAVLRITGGAGADGVIITASGSEKILSTAFQMCRRKGRVVLVGDVAIKINRADIYRKELDFFISTSYGPGRYDMRYEQKGVDYPSACVRWTENRNMQEYLSLIAEGRLKVKPIIEEICPIDMAEDAYFRLKNSPDKPLMVLLSYPEHKDSEQPVRKLANPEFKPGENKGVNAAVIGAGGFAKSMHLPNIKQSELYSLQAVVERKGNDAVAAVKQFNARYSATDYKQVIEDPLIDAVFITTRHNLHARLTVEALKAGKHVFVEKPLAMNEEELCTIQNVVASFGNDRAPLLLTGFNRRFSPFARRIREIVKERNNPMILNYRMNAGYIPLDHWVHGDEGGGRNIGEACHIYDLFTYLTDAHVMTVEAKSIKPADSSISYRDNFIATVTFDDGSVATLTYTALGSPEYPKEILEVYCDNRVLLLDNYNTLTGYGIEDAEVTSAGDKGHLQEITAFAEAVLRKGPSPIPLWQQYQAMEIAFGVDRLMAEWK